jgi:hypothetical protein
MSGPGPGVQGDPCSTEDECPNDRNPSPICFVVPKKAEDAFGRRQVVGRDAIIIASGWLTCGLNPAHFNFKEHVMTEQIAIEETDRLIASDKVEGTNVYNRQGEKLGSVMNFMVNKRSGEAEYAVMQFGGLFGVGSDYYPLPWQVLDYDTEQGGYVVDLDKSQIEGAPSYSDNDTIFDHAYGEQVYGYYGLGYPYI